MTEEHIIKLNPALKEHVWGGTKIRDLLHKDTGGLLNIAESWEVSTHKDGLSTIAGGKYAGKTLNEYFDGEGWGMLGSYGLQKQQLPVLIKYIDASRDLSIQVHPDDDYALTHEGDSGKNETWVVVGAEKGACIYLGFNRQVTRAEVLAAIESGTLEELLNRVEVKEGEIYYIPAGTVHAIGKGCLILEVQQSSNVTYRLYDYGRTGLDGKPRALHVEKALDVLNYSKLKGLDGDNRFRRTADLVGMFSGNTHCRIFRCDGTRDFTFVHSRRDIFFAVTYAGNGICGCDGDEVEVCAGDTLMLNGNGVSVSGGCKTIIISLWS